MYIMLSRIMMRFSACARHFQPCKLRKLSYKTVTAVVNLEDIPQVSVTEIKNALNRHKVAHNDGYTCLVITICPVACTGADSNQNEDNKFYINKTTGLFMCHSCGRTGPWTWLSRKLDEQHQKKTEPPPALVPRPCSVPEPNTRCLRVHKIDDITMNKCLADLNLSHVSTDVLSSLGAYMEPEESRLILPLRGPDRVTRAWKSLTPGEIDSRPIEEILGMRPSALPTSPLLLSNLTTWTDSEVVLVPTAADLLALASQNVPAISLASGTNYLPQEVLPSLENFTKLVLWFGSHINAGRLFARKLGESRCYLVRPTETLLGAHEEMVNKGFRAKLSSIVGEAQAVSHQSIITFAALRGDVECELSRQDLVLGIPWLRFPKLTAILGGFRRGELTIITGPTGSGKTTFMSEYSLDLCMQGVNTLWGSFEIRNARLAKTMLTQLSGMRLENQMENFDLWADKMELLPLHFMAFHGQQPLKTVMEAVHHAAYVYDLGHVVVDNVQFMLGLSESESRHIDRFYRQDMVIESFRRFATTSNCHVTLVIHPRKERTNEELTTSSIFGGAKATQEADNVLLLQDQSTVSVKGRKFLQVAKNRYSGDLGVMPLDFDRESLSFTRRKKSTPSPFASVNPFMSKTNTRVVKAATVTLSMPEQEYLDEDSFE